MAGFEENLQNLVAWARDGVTHDPNRLFRAIVMQFLSDDNPPAAEDRPNLLKILTDIRPKVDLTLRQDLARTLSKYPKPPREIVRLFADDDLAVARIALENSNGLTDADLIEIARKGSVAHRQAIAMRRGLSPAVRIAVFGAGIEADKAAATEEPAAKQLEEESPRSSALDKVEKALERHGNRPIKRDFDRAREFLDKIQSVRAPARKPSVIERAGHAIFDDLKEISDEPKTEDVQRAEAFLAEIGNPGETAAAPDTAKTSSEIIPAAPLTPLAEPSAEPVVVAAPEPEAPEPKIVEPEVSEAVPAIVEPPASDEPTAPTEMAASAEPEPTITEPVAPDEPAAPIETAEPEKPAITEPTAVDESVAPVEMAAPEEPETAIAEPPVSEELPASVEIGVEEPEDEDVLELEDLASDETAPKAPAEPAPAPQGKLVVAGDLFRKGRREDQTVRLAGAVAREGDYARAAVDWAWEADPDGIVTFLSEGAGQALGVAESRVMGKPLAELGHFTGDGRDPRKAAEAMSRRVPFRDQIFETVTDAGEQKSWLVSAVPLFELRSGRFRGYRGTAAANGEGDSAPLPDTEALEEIVKTATAENRELVGEVQSAQAGVAARSDSIASVSHELRTPLNAIMGFSDAMASETFGPLDAKYKEYARDILTSAAEVNQIITDVLDKSKLDAGKMTVSTGPVPLMMLLEQARADVASEAESREMDMTYAATKTELVVDVDADYAQRVMTTVLRSAVRFGKRGGRIGIESVLDRPGVAQINIWNDGPAMAPDTIATMLPHEPRPGEPEKEPQVGLGLTLAVARGLARLMKGEVSLQSKTGVGNRFIVEFPVEA
jgi:signal transduction histidine kinase